MTSQTRKGLNNEDFVHLIIDERFYILHLLSKSSFYLHCDLYSYPKEIDCRRYQHKITMVNPSHDRNFQLILLNSDLELNFTWFLVLEAESWFKIQGFKEFEQIFKIA